MQMTKKSDLVGLVGKELGKSDWITVDQDRINGFADITEDHQFIHVNEEAAAMTPFGGTIAHGFLSLSLLSKLAEGQTLVMEGIKMGINYGFEKVRFINPVRAGKKVRGVFTLKDAAEKSPGQILLTYSVACEIEGEAKPAFIAEWLVMQVTG